MNESKNQKVATGTSLPTLLTVLFVALKLCGIINWSWWWVLSPIPITLGIAVVVFAIVLAVVTIGSGKTKKRPF